MPSEEVLAKAAKDGTIEDAQWSGIFDNMLERLEHNVYKEFPIPSISLPTSAPPLPERQPEDGAPPISSDNSRKENAPPSSSPPRPRTPPRENDPVPVNSSIALPDGTLPPPMQATYDYVCNALTTQFATVPPHTIQRLAELILHPKEHHRFLHSYLNALDRVISVSSGLNAYPSPTSEAAIPTISSGPFVNGVHPSATTSMPSASAFGSDESLGGALLTPIPWLQDRGSDDSIAMSPGVSATAILPSSSPADGQSSASGIDKPSDSAIATPGTASPTSSDAAPDLMDAMPTAPPTAGITQGELLRQQQQSSSPPAPVSSLSSTTSASGSHTSPTASAHTTNPILTESDSGVDMPTTVQEDSEQPHARGPEEIGMEDTGKQAHELGSGQILDMEAAVGRSMKDGAGAAPSTAGLDKPIEDADLHKKETSSASSHSPTSDSRFGDDGHKGQAPEAKDEDKDQDGDDAMPDADAAAAAGTSQEA